MLSLNEMLYLKKKVLVYLFITIFLTFFAVLLDKKIAGIYGLFSLTGSPIYDWTDKL